MAEKDFYAILGVDRNATDDDIKRAYKQLVVKYHPDKQVGKSDAEKKQAEEMIKDINEAYSVLSDKEKRKRYDTFGTSDGNYTFEDAFGQMDDFIRAHAQEMWGFGFGGFGQSPTSYPMDIQVNVNIRLSELFTKSKKTIKYDRYKKCDHCNGTGGEDGKVVTCSRCNGTGIFSETVKRGFMHLRYERQCPECGGTGKNPKHKCKHCNGIGVVRTTEELSFIIPEEGVTTGAYFNKEMMGNETADGMVGNLRVVITVLDEKGFHINPKSAYDIGVVKEVPIIDCITGGDVTIRNIDGKDYKFTVKPGTVNGDIIKLKNCGLKMMKGQRGYLEIYIKQKMPESLGKSDLKLLNKLRDSKNFK